MKKLLLLLSVPVVLLTADVSRACSCVPAKSPAEELKRATAVFSGKVVKIKKHKTVDIFGAVEVVFQVEKVWKGVEQRTVSVFTSSNSAACGYGFKKGATYLVYAHGGADGNLGSRLSTGICNRTRRLKDAIKDVEELGPEKITTGGFHGGAFCNQKVVRGFGIL